MKQMYSKEEVIKLIEENSCKLYAVKLSWVDEDEQEGSTGEISIPLDTINISSIASALAGRPFFATDGNYYIYNYDNDTLANILNGESIGLNTFKAFVKIAGAFVEFQLT